MSSNGHGPERAVFRPAQRRVVRVAAALLVVVGVANVAVAARESEAKTRPSDALAGPLLSARRTPAVLRTAIGRQNLAAAVNVELAKPEVATAINSSCVSIRAAGGRVLDVGSDRSVLPASTLKVLTSIAALKLLPNDQPFVTRLRSSAQPANGVLTGDLWFVGGGDPLLETKDYSLTQEHRGAYSTSLEELVDKLIASGVTAVQGNLVGDDRMFDDVRGAEGWKANYVRDGEVGPIAGLVVNDNFTTVDAKGGRKAATDVGRDAAEELRRVLTAKNISVTGESVSARATGAPAAVTAAPVELASITSKPLGEIVKELLLWSDNTTAEVLLKNLGVATSQQGTSAAGVSAVRGVLESIGLDLSAMATVDGSGLSRSDHVNCRLLTDAIAALPDDSPVLAGMPVMGESGTLRKRLRGSVAAGRVRAKTGSLNGVSALAGRATTLQQESVDFALLMNDLQSTASGVAVGNAISLLLVNYPDAPSLQSIAMASTLTSTELDQPTASASTVGAGVGSAVTSTAVPNTAVPNTAVPNTGVPNSGDPNTAVTSIGVANTAVEATAKDIPTSVVSSGEIPTGEIVAGQISATGSDQ